MPRGRERRGECRYPTNASCTAHVVGTRTAERHDARMLNISVSGTLLESRSNVPLGLQLGIDVNGEVYYGKVRRAETRRRFGILRRRFLLGVQMEKPWPNDLFSALAFPQVKPSAS